MIPMPLPSTFTLVALLALTGLVGGAAYLHETASDCDGAAAATGVHTASGGTGCPAAQADCVDDEIQRFDRGPGTAWGVIRIAIDNDGRALDGSVCLVDADGIPRDSQGFRVAADKTTTFDLEVPEGRYMTTVDLRSVGGPVGGGSVALGQEVDLQGCAEGAALFPITVRSHEATGIAANGKGARCIERPDEAMVPPLEARMDLPTLGDEPVGRLGLLGLGAAAFVTALAALHRLLRSEACRWGVLGLFSRVTRRRALDQDVRAQIQRIIEADPGIRAEEVRRGVGIASGQVAHHLRVLVASGLVTRVRIGGVHHHFVAGCYGVADMRRQAVLRRGATRVVYERLLTGGEGSVSEVATRTGLSVGAVSRLAARLVAVGLVARRREGRRVVLQAKEAGAR